MGHHSIDLDLGGALAPPRACPACHSSDLRPVCGEQGLVFLCPGCTRTWFSDLGTLLPADTPEGSVGDAGPPPVPLQRGSSS